MLACCLLAIPLMHGSRDAMASEPPFNPMEETLIVGSGVTPGAEASLGRWSERSGRLSAPSATAKRGGWWLAGGTASAWKDGQVRVRFAAHKKLDQIILVRATAGGSGKLASGVGLRIKRGRISLVKVTSGHIQEIVPERKHSQIRNKGELEAVLQIFGSHLVASLYDEPSGRPIGALSSSALPPATANGRVGVLLGPRNDSRAPITLFTSRKACGVSLEVVPERLPQIMVQVAGKASDKARKLASLREKLPGLPAATALLTSPAGLERLFCSKEKLLRVATDLPWKYIDRDYLKRKDKPFIPKLPGFSAAEFGYLDPVRTNKLLLAFHNKYPGDTRLVKLGASHLGHKIYGLAIGKGLRPDHNRPSMLIAGAHHGDEPLSALLILDIISQLLQGQSKDKRIQRWLEELVIWCVPLVNPDGLETFLEYSSRYGRKNGRDLPRDRSRVDLGVDLNRNYPIHWKKGGRKASSGEPSSMYYRGPSAGSEPETEALMRLARRERFVGALTLHTGTVKVLAPYTIDGLISPEPNVAWMVAEKLVEGLPRHPQKRDWIVRRKLYSVDGTDQDWLYQSHGTVALLLEIARWTPLKAENRQAVFDAVRPLWTGLLQRYVAGPAIQGQVVDASGKPLAADVKVKEVVYYQNERWSTRSRDGRFARYLPGPGGYTLTVKADGHAPVTQKYKVKGTPVRVRIQLP